MNTWWPLIAAVILLLAVQAALFVLALLLAARVLGQAIAEGMRAVPAPEPERGQARPAGHTGRRRAADDRPPVRATGTAHAPQSAYQPADATAFLPRADDATAYITPVRDTDTTAQIRRLR